MRRWPVPEDWYLLICSYATHELTFCTDDELAQVFWCVCDDVKLSQCCRNVQNDSKVIVYFYSLHLHETNHDAYSLSSKDRTFRRTRIAQNATSPCSGASVVDSLSNCPGWLWANVHRPSAKSDGRMITIVRNDGKLVTVPRAIVMWRLPLPDTLGAEAGVESSRRSQNSRFYETCRMTSNYRDSQ